MGAAPPGKSFIFGPDHSSVFHTSTSPAYSSWSAIICWQIV
jgi:hypothetical protein